MQLTTAQLGTLKVDITANTNTIGGVQIKDLPHTSDNSLAIAVWYNGQASPNFTVWKLNVPLVQIGDKINAAELAGLTQVNLVRLQTIATYGPQGINPSMADRRAAFDDIFSGAGGAITRPALLALWKRFATFAEKLFATGTGSDASPATMSTTAEGNLTSSEVQAAWNQP